LLLVLVLVLDPEEFGLRPFEHFEDEGEDENEDEIACACTNALATNY